MSQRQVQSKCIPTITNEKETFKTMANETSKISKANKMDYSTVRRKKKRAFTRK